MKTIPISTDNDLHALGLEAQALDDFFAKSSQDYYDTPAAQGKSWFAIGLESNEDAQEKDTANKGSIIKRMIEAIKKFIKSFIAKIKGLFVASPEQVKADNEFAKEYAEKGPSEEQLKKSTQKAQAAQQAKAAPSSKTAPTASADEVKNAEKVVGQKVTPEQARSFYNGEKMALISSMLGADRLALVAAMMEPGFYISYKEAIDITMKWTSTNLTTDLAILDKRMRELREALEVCNGVIEEFVKEGEESNRKALAKWVMGKDHAAIQRINSYFDGHISTTMHTANSIRQHLEIMDGEVERAGHTDPQHAQEHLKHCQRETAALAAHTSLLAKVDGAYCTVIKGLRK